MQWGYSGLINFGVMGFLAIGGLAVIVISVPPVYAAWDAGGTGIIMSGLLLAALVYAVFYVHSKVTSKYKKLYYFCTCNINCTNNESYFWSFNTRY